MKGCAHESHPARADRDAPGGAAPALAAPYAIEPVDETERRTRIERLKQLLSERVVFLDGAMGTMIQLAKLDEAGYRGDRLARHGHDLKGNNDILTLTRPQLIADIHRAYLDAGAGTGAGAELRGRASGTQGGR
jgi:hypothetical protein